MKAATTLMGTCNVLRELTELEPDFRLGDGSKNVCTAMGCADIRVLCKGYRYDDSEDCRHLTVDGMCSKQ